MVLLWNCINPNTPFCFGSILGIASAIIIVIILGKNNIGKILKHNFGEFNPDDSPSSYNWSGVDITVYNGFVKGIQKGEKGSDSLVIRALSPLPTVDIKAANMPVKNISVSIENINPELYAKSVEKGLNPARTTVNTLKFAVDLNAGEEKKIEPTQPNNTENSNYVVLGDSRDRYETFGFYAWFDKNPALGCLAVMGTIVALIILIILSKRFDELLTVVAIAVVMLIYVEKKEHVKNKKGNF